jgi:SAM-dependent methyltransferase
MDARTADLRRAYDADAERRDAREPEPWRHDIADALAARVHGGGAGRRVLELGCGTGQLARRLGDHDLEVVAVDLSAAMVAQARSRGVEALVADLARLPFADASFHGALAFNSLLHTPRTGLGAVFAEVGRVLAPDAPFVVVVWGGETKEGPLDRDWLEPARFFSLLSDADLLELQTPGFNRLETRLLHEHDSHGLHPQVLTLSATRDP